MVADQLRVVRFLIDAVRGLGDPAAGVVVPSGVGAQQVARAAVAHRVPGVAHRALVACGGDAASVLATDAEAGMVRFLQSLALCAQLREAFACAGVPWLVLKGPVVAQVGYAVPTARWFGDVDVLVAAPDVGRAVAACEGFGCELVDRNFELVRSAELGEVHLTSRVGVGIDLHFDVINSARRRRLFGVDSRQFLALRQEYLVQGQSVFGPDAASGLIHLIVHAALGGGDRLGWLADVWGWWLRAQPDPAVVVQLARLWRCELVVGLLLHRVDVTLGLADAVPVVRELLTGSQLRVARWVNQVQRWAVCPGSGSVGKVLVSHAGGGLMSAGVVGVRSVVRRRWAGAFVDSVANPGSVLFDSSAVCSRDDLFAHLAQWEPTLRS